MAENMEYMNGVLDIGTLNGKGLEICDKLRRRNVDLCCSQEVRWRGCEARLIGLAGWKYKLWQSGNQEKYCGVKVLVKEELCDKVIEVRRVEDRDANNH